MGKNKKPTMMEVKNAINNLIAEFLSLSDRISKIDALFFKFLTFSGKQDEFKAWLENENKSEKEEK